MTNGGDTMEECKPILNTGLRGFKVASTKISDVDGGAGKLVYRGYLIKDLAGKISFEEKLILIIFIITAFLWIFRIDLNLGFITIPGWSNILPYPDFYAPDAFICRNKIVPRFYIIPFSSI